MKKRLVNGNFSSIPMAQLMLMAEGADPEEADDKEELTAEQDTGF